MPLIQYRTQRFNGKARKTVEQAKVIIDDLKSQGYTLTLRQLYYQMVSKNMIANSEKEYKRLGSIITDAREIGEIDWYAIEDRGRQAYFHPHVPTAKDVLKGIEYALRIDPWLDQDTYLEVWVEKAALEGVVERPSSRWKAPYMACKGYLSASEAWRAGQRFEEAIARGKKPVLLHLGDHDPSGMHMTVDNDTRLGMFARAKVDVRRLALNMDQIEHYKPPPNPTKMTDTRAAGYGLSTSWELDALSPKVIDDLIDGAIQSVIDKDKWAKSLAVEAERRKPLALIRPRWDEVEQLVLTAERPLDRLKAIDEVLYAAQSVLQVHAPEQAARLEAAGTRTPFDLDAALAKVAEESDGDQKGAEPEFPLPEGYEEDYA